MGKPQTYRGVTLTANGVGYAGELQEFDPPEIKEKLESYRGGNMAGEIELPVGFETMTASFVLSRHDANIHVMQAILGRKGIFVFRSVIDEFGDKQAVKWVIDGRIKSTGYGTVKPGVVVNNKHEISVIRYLKTINDVPVEMVDFEAGEASFSGVDVLEAVRDLIGI